MTDYYEKEEKLKKQIQNLENEEKILKKEEKELKRKERSHRLIVRGAMLEKHLKKPLILSDEDIDGLLEYIFALKQVDELLNDLISEREAEIAGSDQGNGIA